MSCPVLSCLLFLFSLMQPISLALSLSTIFILLSLLSFQFPLRSPPPLPLHPFCPPSLLYSLLDFSIIFLYYITFSSPSPHLSTSYLRLLVYYIICFLLRFWTESYAMPREEVAGNEAHPAVRRLVEMGFAEEDCRQALLTHKGNAFRFLQAFISALFFSLTFVFFAVFILYLRLWRYSLYKILLFNIIVFDSFFKAMKVQQLRHYWVLCNNIESEVVLVIEVGMGRAINIHIYLRNIKILLRFSTGIR